MVLILEILLLPIIPSIVVSSIAAWSPIHRWPPLGLRAHPCNLPPYTVVASCQPGGFTANSVRPFLQLWSSEEAQLMLAWTFEVPRLWLTLFVARRWLVRDKKQV